MINPVITILDFTSVAVKHAASESHGAAPTDDLVKRVVTHHKHLAILRHGFASVRISKISRSCGRQVLRKAHADYVEKSQRYQDVRNSLFVMPEAIEMLGMHPEDSKHNGLHNKIVKHLNDAREIYSELRAIGVLKEDARDVMPEMTETSMVMSGNLQMWWDFFVLRIDTKAQKHIRMVATAILYAFAAMDPIFKSHPKYEEAVCSKKASTETLIEKHEDKVGSE